MPVATIALLVLLLASAYFSLGNPEAATSWGFIPKPLAVVGLGERLLAMLTSLFVHIDPVHLLANTVMLAGAGPAIEKAAGAFRFLVVFFVGGVVGVFLHWGMSLVAMPSIAPEPLIGASGAVASLIGYAWLRFHRRRIPVLPGRTAPLWVFVVVWILLQVLGAIFAVQKFGVPVAYWAHLGGFIAGFTMAYLFKAQVSADEEESAARVHDALREGGAAVDAVVSRRASERTGDAESQKQLYEISVQRNDEETARLALSRLLEVDPDFAVERLAERLELGTLNVSVRAKLASSGRVSSQSAELLWTSILEEEPNSETPNALFALLESSHEALRKGYAARLAKEYSLSPQTETARLRWPELFR